MAWHVGKRKGTSPNTAKSSQSTNKNRGIISCTESSTSTSTSADDFDVAQGAQGALRRRGTGGEKVHGGRELQLARQQAAFASHVCNTRTACCPAVQQFSQHKTAAVVLTTQNGRRCCRICTAAVNARNRSVTHARLLPPLSDTEQQ